MDNQNSVLKENYLIKELEFKIKHNQFKNKEELQQYIINLKNQGVSDSELDHKKINELLSLYDELNKTDEIPLDMNKYASVGLENKNLIVSKETDQILETHGSKEDMTKEFKSIQNEIMEAINKDNIKLEILSKIKFFVTNSRINPYSYKVNIENGKFYNVETNEVYEVRKNENTNQYEIYKGSELTYGSDINQQENNIEKEIDKPEEELAYEQRLNKPKVRTLKKPMNNYHNAAFTRITFLITNIITFIAMITMMYFLNR